MYARKSPGRVGTGAGLKENARARTSSRYIGASSFVCNAEIKAVAESLGARLRRIGPHEWAGPCPVCGGHDRFSINTRRSPKQLWNCRGCGRGGDVTDLVRHVRGCGYLDALRFLGADHPAAPVSRMEPKPALIEPDPDSVRKLDSAKRIISELVPVAGSPGEAYLRDTRKIDVEAIADVLSRVDAIGWHPAVYFNEPGNELHGKRLGAIIGIMTDALTALPTGAISRTYIHQGGKIGKAKTLGTPAGIVRLTPDDEVLGGLCLAEGLETALDAMARGLRPMWSIGSTALMSGFPVLPGIEALTIVADHDANGAGEKAARECEARWLAADREVTIFQSDALGDLNDATRRVA